jgi:hypothetical protein
MCLYYVFLIAGAVENVDSAVQHAVLHEQVCQFLISNLNFYFDCYYYS